MASKRDLVEAHAFSRRRLVTAFVSGAPGGREVEPPRPGRTMVGGVALAVLLVAGAAITGIFTDAAPADWTQPGLVISKETGTPYVIVDEGDDPEVHPVINITSAQLILGPDASSPRVIAEDTINEQPLGDELGILGAPSEMPGQDRLVQTGWTSCMAAGLRMATSIAEDPSVSAASSSPASYGWTVRTKDDGGSTYWVVAETTIDGVAQALRYQLPAQRGQADAVLSALGLTATGSALDVRPDWLALFPRGGDLDASSFAVPGFGEPVPDVSGASVGQYVVGADGTPYGLSAGGPFRLDPFAYAVYTNSVFPTRKGSGLPQKSSLADRPDQPEAVGVYSDARWPTTTLTPGDGEACAQLATSDAASVTRLVADPTGDASASGLNAGGTSVMVERGRAAYVATGPSTSFAVDGTGRADVLVGSDVAAQFGWTDAPPQVSDAWIEILDPGVPLSREAALCPPAAPDSGSQGGGSGSTSTASVATVASTAGGGTCG